MLSPDLIEKNKNKILSAGIILLALFVAFQFYSGANQKVALLEQEQENELKKNKTLEDILGLEKQAEVYKKTFVKKDLASVMDVLSNLAKASSVKIDSVKPVQEDKTGGYLNSAFLITLKAPGYNALGDFISKIESYKDIYFVSEVNIDSVSPETVSGEENIELGVSLKINTAAYL